MDNGYTYDAVSNVLSVANKAALPESGKAGGQMAHAYTYDALYRLASATGTYAGADSKTASYRLEMGYDNMHRIVSKKQHLTQQGVQFDGTLHVGYDLAYTYGKTEGRKFQLAEVKDANYRTEENPDSVAKVDNNHTYTYDANGNLVYVNTGRIKQDGALDYTAAERKLRWDEENRLTASDDNGFVTNYWYDADGERTVKTSGEGEQLYVNSEFAGGRTNTAKFSLYVSPYLVANQGGRYTKHIYIGSQRIVSKIGDFASYGSDPRRIQYAGSETDGLSVNYKQKYSAQQQVIKDNYTIFEVPYNGTDNNDYVDGQGFCCDDSSPEAAQARALALENNFQDPDAYEKLQFYYHPDHLGSSSYITNLDGEVVQHIEYVPFGEVFIEERNSIWNTPYLFNAKEFDEETGMYYYGARYYDPRLSLWISTDPLQEKYPHINSYCYTANNPILFVDQDGKAIIKGAVAAFKYAKRVWNVYKKTGKLTPSNLKKAGLDEFLDIAGDIQTVFDGDASHLDKLSAIADLVIGTDFNKKGQKQVLKLVDNAKSKIKPNDGDAKPHGGLKHNEKIDNLIEKLKSGNKAQNIRKNQKQVDIDGNVVGNNRPDVQFDYNGVHTNVEYDTRTRSMEKHKKQLPKNDPNARNKFYKINDK
jgi:RHS repeat-associated protein